MPQHAPQSECLPVPWESLSDADPLWAGITPSSIESFSGHRGVFRIRVPGSSLIWKTATPWEAEIQTRIAAELDRVVPAVYGRPVPLPRTGGGLVGILMEDLAGEATPGIAEQLALYGRAAARLARVHSHFDGALSRLPKPKSLAHGLSEAIPDIPGLLRLMVAVAGIPLEERLIEEIRQIGDHVEEHLARCSAAESLTLIHGDFHTGNILCDAGGAVRIIDWAAAATGPPEWDLVMCGEPQVAEYLEARGWSGSDTFAARLRSVVVVRMFEFIRAAVGVVFGEGEAPFEPLLMSIPFYAARLVEAANTERFCGGDPGRSVTNG